MSMNQGDNFKTIVALRVCDGGLLERTTILRSGDHYYNTAMGELILTDQKTTLFGWGKLDGNAIGLTIDGRPYGVPNKPDDDVKYWIREEIEEEEQ